MKVLYRPEQLHIPDGLLSPTIAIIFWIFALVLLTIAVRKSRLQITERDVPMMGVMAAFIFAAQMINFPVAGGTSGHMLGGVLAAITLGPWAGMLVMSAVIGVQALLFQDGGLLVMGANIFNMGLLTVLIGYGVYRGVANQNRKLKLVGVFAAGWLSVMGGALMTSFQLWFSGTAALRLVFPAMLGVHALIGIGEGLITSAALSFILRTRPDLLRSAENGRTGKGWVLTGVLIALGVLMLAPFASGSPDGLERVAIDLGFIGVSQAARYEILPDYTVPLVGSGGISIILAGGIGMLVIAGLIFGAVRLLRKNI